MLSSEERKKRDNNDAVLKSEHKVRNVQEDKEKVRVFNWMDKQLANSDTALEVLGYLVQFYPQTLSAKKVVAFFSKSDSADANASSTRSVY